MILFICGGVSRCEDSFFGCSSKEISEKGDLKKDASAALFKVTSDYVNYIEGAPIAFYDQDYVDAMQARTE